MPKTSNKVPKTLDEVTEEIEKLVHDNGLKMAMLLQSEDCWNIHICSGIRAEGVMNLMIDLGDQSIITELEDELKEEIRKGKNN